MTLNINQLLSIATTGPSRWELDNVVWNERTTDPETLVRFLNRIQQLESIADIAEPYTTELAILKELANDMDQAECEALLAKDDDTAQTLFIETIARRSALETLCNNKISMETMTLMCKLNPNDFILSAKRSQDIINAIRELVIQGETLSTDVAGA
jgi:hypothetical protein